MGVLQESHWQGNMSILTKEERLTLKVSAWLGVIALILVWLGSVSPCWHKSKRPCDSLRSLRWYVGSLSSTDTSCIPNVLPKRQESGARGTCWWTNMSENTTHIPICQECGLNQGSPFGLTCQRWGCFGRVKSVRIPTKKLLELGDWHVRRLQSRRIYHLWDM